MAGAGNWRTFFYTAFIIGALAEFTDAIIVTCAWLTIGDLAEICAIASRISTRVLYIVKARIDGAIAGAIAVLIKLAVAGDW